MPLLLLLWFEIDLELLKVSQKPHLYDYDFEEIYEVWQ